MPLFRGECPHPDGGYSLKPAAVFEDTCMVMQLLPCPVEASCPIGKLVCPLSSCWAVSWFALRPTPRRDWCRAAGGVGKGCRRPVTVRWEHCCSCLPAAFRPIRIVLYDFQTMPLGILANHGHLTGQR